MEDYLHIFGQNRFTKRVSVCHPLTINRQHLKRHVQTVNVQTVNCQSPVQSEEQLVWCCTSNKI